MTAEQVFDKWCDISQPMDLYVVKLLAINAMKEYSRLMCDKQKAICLTRTGLVPYKGLIGIYLDVDRECIINSPYPDELQRDN